MWLVGTVAAVLIAVVPLYLIVLGRAWPSLVGTAPVVVQPPPVSTTPGPPPVAQPPPDPPPNPPTAVTPPPLRLDPTTGAPVPPDSGPSVSTPGPTVQYVEPPWFKQFSDKIKRLVELNRRIAQARPEDQAALQQARDRLVREIETGASPPSPRR